MSRQTNPFRSFFSSVKLTIVLLVLIALFSIIGTFIPQQEGAHEFVKHLSPGLAGLLQTLQIFDLYHSYFFYLLMGLLSLNLIVCSVNRFPLSLKQYQASPFPGPAGIFENPTPERMLVVYGETTKAVQSIESILRTKYRDVRKEATEGGIVLFGQRGRFSLFGVYAVHASILLMIIGALTGSLFGFEAFVNIGEGETIHVVDLKGAKGIKKLNYQVRCDKFAVELYETGAPKTYRSDLSFIKSGQVVLQGPLLVNHPLTFENHRFYQSSYGMSPDSRAVLSYNGGAIKGREMSLIMGDTFELPEKKAKAIVLRVEDNLMEMGPAVKLRITSPKDDVQFWVFKHIEDIKARNPEVISEVPLFNPGLFRPYVFSLREVEQQYYTGLQVVHDPGVPIVAAGGFLMVAGLLTVFLISHRRIWIRMEGVNEGTGITIAGRSSRNTGGLDRDIDLLYSRIRKEMKV